MLLWTAVCSNYNVYYGPGLDIGREVCVQSIHLYINVFVGRISYEGSNSVLIW